MQVLAVIADTAVARRILEHPGLDATGLRTKKTDSYGTTRYLLDGLSVIGQYAQDGTRQAFYVQS